jgi:hypothetical protein
MWSRQLLFWFMDDFERRKRMLKSRWMSGLMALALVLTFAQSGLAQINISVTGNASPSETETNVTAETNDPISGGTLFILGTALSDADVSIGGLRITYPVAITSTEAFPAGDPISVLSATGFFIDVGTDDIVVNYADGRLEIDLPNSITTAINGATGTISLGGIRLDASDADADESVDASVALFVGTTDASAGQTDIATGLSNINVNLQTSTFEAITSLDPGIDEVDINSELVVSTTGASLDDGRIDIVEGHTRAWLDSTQIPGALNDAGLRLVFTGIPEGMELDLSPNTGGDIDSFTISPATVDADDNEAVITWLLADLPDPDDQEEIRIDVELGDVDEDEITAGDVITVRVTMDPEGDPLDDFGTTTNDDDAPLTSELPRFAEDLSDAQTIVSIVPATTTMLIPYATRIASIGYDTGIAIANTSLDPYENAEEQTGGLTFHFFPNEGDGPGETFSFTTDGPITGTALNADGELEPGATFVALLSTLLAEAGETGDFTGYIFVETAFQFAHGAAFISDFANFTSATNVLVMNNPEFEDRPDDDVESLGF